MRPLRVAWDNSLAGRNQAGTGVYASQLIRELSALPDLHLEVFAGSSAAGESVGTLARGLRALRRLAWIHWSFPRALRQQSFDLLHSPSFIIPLHCPCPSVVTIHDLTYLIFPDHFEHSWRTYVRSAMPSVLARSAAIICVSEHTREDLLRFYDVPAAKVHVVYNGVDHARFRPGLPLDPQWKQGIGLRGEYLLHVGSLSHRKNIPTLLRAIAWLRDAGKWGARQLVLAGSESKGLPGADAVHQAIRDLELTHDVVLAGHVPDSVVPSLYAHAALVVMPSLYEGFGLTMLESMASGTPVLASDASCLPEIAANAALLFPEQDHHALAAAIQEVLESPSVAEQLRSRGLARAAEFSWQKTAKQTMAVYRSVAGS